VDYLVQPGDTLPVLAAHFNTTVTEIRAANPDIPIEVTTLPPGMPMRIPIYYHSLWGSDFQIIPDSLFVNGPAQVGFDSAAFIAQRGGWLKDYQEYTYYGLQSAAEVIDNVATLYSVSPRLLLALLDFQVGALTLRQQPLDSLDYPLGYRNYAHIGLYLQLNWAANLLNQGYYTWRSGQLETIEHLDSRVEYPDPWQNAATVALQYYFSHIYPFDGFKSATGPEGLALTYASLFGDIWANVVPHIPGSLQQPPMRLPFPAGNTWAFTGGPHTAWGDGAPWTALDFAPPSAAGGCSEADDMVVAVADGVIARTDTGIAVLDLDGDGDERTGWTVFYLHLSTQGKPPVGTQLKAGDPIGHPSCERGRSTGTHIHIARKYNGEWIPAEGLLAFNLEGWIAWNGSEPYLGYLRQPGLSVRACVCSDPESHITSK